MGSFSDWRDTCPTNPDKNLYLLNSKLISDVIFLVGETKEAIHAHKFILIRASPVFETQFGERWNQEEGIEIPEVSPHTFRMFLEFLYADKFSVTENEAADVLSLAHKYMIKCLVEKCVDILASVINVSNVILIHQTATKFNEENLEQKALEFILMNGRAVLDDIGFLQISKDTLSHIIGSNRLATEEIIIFRALMRWAENKCEEEKLDYTVENKSLILKDLIPLIRFTLMTSEEFTNEVCIGQHDGILSAEESNLIYKYRNVGQSMRTHLPSLPYNENKRRHENLYKVNIYEPGVGHFRGVNCQHDLTGDSVKHCYAGFVFSSNRKIQMMGIELRQSTESGENLMNSTYLAFTDPKSPRTVLQGICADLYLINWTDRLDGIFLPRSVDLWNGFGCGVWIERKIKYSVTLHIKGGVGESSMKSISPGVGLKLAEKMICEEGDVEFKFDIWQTRCYQQDSHKDNCICTGLIKAIHFKI